MTETLRILLALSMVILLTLTIVYAGREGLGILPPNSSISAEEKETAPTD